MPPDHAEDRATACHVESEMLRRFAIVIAIVTSLGWVVPLFLAMWFMLDWCRFEASPIVYGSERKANSFPFLAAAAWMLNTAAIWAAAALAVWLMAALWFVACGKPRVEPRDAIDTR